MLSIIWMIFFLCGKQGTTQCAPLVSCFKQLMSELGVPLTGEKSEGPCMALTFLGIELDMVQQSSRLPEDKLINFTDRVQSMLLRKKVTLRELQRIVGHL